MNIDELKQIMKNKLTAEQEAKNSAYMRGDLVNYEKYEESIKNVEEIIAKLES